MREQQFTIAVKVAVDDADDWHSHVGNLEKKLYKFDEVVSRSADELEPHYVTNFLTEIAGDFNSYYGNNVIVDEKDLGVTAYRISLTIAFANIMKKGMEILAIPVLERMQTKLI